MPTGDKTGPENMGAKTGRGAGFCAGYGYPGYMNPAFGFPMHRRIGGGRRFRRWQRHAMHMGWGGYGFHPGAYPPPPMTEEQEQEALKAQESWLQEQLDSVRSRMKKEA